MQPQSAGAGHKTKDKICPLSSSRAPTRDLVILKIPAFEGMTIEGFRDSNVILLTYGNTFSIM